MFAGAAIAAGLWMLFQLLLTGGALSAADHNDVGDIREFGIGAGIGSVIAPLLAMFIGGLIAGRMARHYDVKLGALHGGLVWAITSVLGLVFLSSAVSALVDRTNVSAQVSDVSAPEGAEEYLDENLKRVNEGLKAQNAPSLSEEHLIDASRFASAGRGGIDREAFVARLDEKTELSRPEAEAALRHLGDRAPDVVAAATAIGEQRRAALDAADKTGKALLAAGLGLLLCLLTAIGGAIIGARSLLPRKNRGDRDRGGEHRRGGEVHTTAPYPTTTQSGVGAAEPYTRDPNDPYPSR